MTEQADKQAPAKRPGRRADPTTALFAQVKAARKAYTGLAMPIAGGRNPLKGQAHHEREANRWRAADTARKYDGVPGWDSALLAEAYRTLAEPDAGLVRAGLVRLAAIAVTAAESLDEESA
ncbi:hypothetical protein CIB93_08855 [Streptomyces sp. WZ.A104]|uniref:hypothetical protein n=1 Tax=Streptomyces sp. WZ.A104 TaxID=2023771 RepID=UPI000BBC6302|nr:hypothetical protein [Streptomyces sp. WZ.A104]PCG86338.1 hypothetical protein CIB93_08855 [Streptomyces sp. WZ.A104]